jgi:hypothetical protein
MSNLIVICVLILGMLLSNMSQERRSRGMHSISQNAANTPQPQRNGAWKNRSKSRKKKQQQPPRQQDAGDGTHLNFSHEGEEEEYEWECFAGSSTAQKSSTYISSEKMVHTKLQNVPSLNPPRPPPDPKFIISMVLVEYEGIRVYHQS